MPGLFPRLDHNIGALIIRIGLGGYNYTIVIIRNPRSLILIIKAPTLLMFRSCGHTCTPAELGLLVGGVLDQDRSVRTSRITRCLAFCKPYIPNPLLELCLKRIFVGTFLGLLD